MEATEPIILREALLVKPNYFRNQGGIVSRLDELVRQCAGQYVLVQLYIYRYSIGYPENGTVEENLWFGQLQKSNDGLLTVRRQLFRSIENFWALPTECYVHQGFMTSTPDPISEVLTIPATGYYNPSFAWFEHMRESKYHFHDEDPGKRYFFGDHSHIFQSGHQGLLTLAIGNDAVRAWLTYCNTRGRMKFNGCPITELVGLAEVPR